MATYEPGWVFATVFISDATATTSRGSANFRLVDRATPIERVTRLAGCVAAPFGSPAEVAALGVDRVVEGVGGLLERLDRVTGQRLDLLGRADDDEVVAADVADERRRQADLHAPPGAGTRASAAMNSSPRREAVRVVDGLEPVDVDVADGERRSPARARSAISCRIRLLPGSPVSGDTSRISLVAAQRRADPGHAVPWCRTA